MNEPNEIVAGFTYTWEETLSDYSADDGWVLKYSAINSSQAFNFSASGSGKTHTITLPATTTENYTAGTYRLTKYVENTDGTKTWLAEYILVIKPTPITDTAFDSRSHAQIMLDAIEALEEGRATKEQQSFTIAGRSILYLTPEQLLKWKNYYKQQVFVETNPQNKITPKRLIQFKNA